MNSKEGRRAAQPASPGALVRSILAAAAVCLHSGLLAAEEWNPVDTHDPAEKPLLPAEAMRKLQLQPGFQVTLASAEPNIRQPIAIAYDERGRLWVAESYSYAGSDFTNDRRDRILVFEDADGDGVFESRKVFHDGLNRLTGLNVGFGGVWITAPPHFAFIPDRDRDDRPDGEPVVLLDGWTLKAEHNSVNGLTWGPDGWLYGRHGNKQPSLVGRPDDAKERRQHLSCAIWRYHPVDARFEVVADGTVNPWGLDFDDFGQGFLSTSVIDHFWHLAPGARYDRGPGRAAHPNPRTYELMEPSTDHRHWGGNSYEKITRVSEGNAPFGGGHSHSDAMIYLGDRWPAQYRGSVFLSNIHGRRINRDRIERENGTGRYLARHETDLLVADDKWFRAVSLLYGPDGDVVMTDWSDTGECHDRDGVHRSSGRIYKISWGAPRRVSLDLAAKTSEELAELQLHRNDWHVRHARRILQERATAGVDLTAAHTVLRRIFDSHPDVSRKLRALWALHVTKGTNEKWLRNLLNHESEHVVWWAVRFATERRVDDIFVRRLAGVAQTDSRWLVRMGLASALERMEPPARMTVARALITQCAPDIDANLSRLIWYGIEPLVTNAPDSALSLAEVTRVPRLRRFLARRLAEEMRAVPVAGEALFGVLDATTETAAARDVLEGALQGLAGARDVPAPPRARIVLKRWLQPEDAETTLLALRLASNLGDKTAAAPLRQIMMDPKSQTAARLAALDALVRSRPDALVDDLLRLLPESEMVEAVIRGLASFPDPRVAPTLLAAIPTLPTRARMTAIDVLATRVDSAHLLLDALAERRLVRRDISAAQARQLAQFGDPKLTAKLETAWGNVNAPAGELRAAIRRMRAMLTSETLAAANLTTGAALYAQRCATCHRLFDRGGQIGPDLTGSGRKDLDYLLPNIIDPNAVIPADYRLCVITTHDGRVISGTIGESEHTVVVQTITERLTINRSDIREIRRLSTSLMPTGLLDSLSADETRDLVAYLMSEGSDAAQDDTSPRR